MAGAPLLPAYGPPLNATDPSCLVYVNTLMLQRVLGEPAWMARMTPADVRGLTPLVWGHVSPYGTFDLDMEQRLDLEPREAA